jgi:hypothetical protein
MIVNSFYCDFNQWEGSVRGIRCMLRFWKKEFIGVKSFTTK